MKKSYLFFRNYVANITIALLFIIVGLVTYQGGVIGVFSSTNDGIIWSGNTNNGTVSFMFNVYMGNEYVEEIIDVLSKNNIKATFFVGGIWVCKNEECFMKIFNSGNEIGSHGYWHKDHSKISNEEQANEILMTENLVLELTGLKMTLFAPPSGAYNKNTALIAENLGYKTIMWSKDTIDWRDQDNSKIISRASDSVSSGDLILMHPTKATAESLETIISNIIAKGLKISTVGSNII